MNISKEIDDQLADHRRWLRELELAHFEPTSPGMPYWLPRGLIAMRALQEHWRQAHERLGYQEVSTPPMARDPVYLSSGHLPHYEGNMFFTDGGEGGRFGLKPVNCPGTMVIFRSRRRSHRELPLRLACFDLLYRNELSGVLTGMLRLQAFRQDDAHIFLAPEQIQDEVVNLVRLAERVYTGFGLRFKLRLGGPPESRIGDDATWASAEASLASALDAAVGPDAYHRAEGEGGFYGPKADLLVSDALGRDWQVGTIQLDHEMPRRLGCVYMVLTVASMSPPSSTGRCSAPSSDSLASSWSTKTGACLPSWPRYSFVWCPSQTGTVRQRSRWPLSSGPKASGSSWKCRISAWRRRFGTLYCAAYRSSA